ncbi:ferric reductase like transmembrane component-domain-containing protein [Aspergillus crustosus]
MRPLAYLSLLISATSVSSSILPVDERCVTAVYTAYTYITFSGRYSRKYLEARCENPLQVISIYASSDVYCKPHERLVGISQLEGICRDAGLQLISRGELADNLTEHAIKQMRSVDWSELPRDQVMDAPVLLSPTHYHRIFATLDIWAYEMWTHYTYGYLSYLYWGFVLLLGSLHRMIEYFVFSRHNTPSQRRIYFPFRRVYHWIQTHFLVATALPSEGREFFWWTFSNRAEALVTVGFWILSTVVCFIGYCASSENIYWPDTFSQLTRYAADRTGIVSFANLPLLWLFAGRNNICAWATGWNFATFNVFHRHVAWIATVQAVAHTVLYLVLFFQHPNPWKSLTKPYILWGTLATVLMVLILPAAITWFRHRAYETFLLIHIVFSIAVLVGCFYHVIIFEDQEYWAYLWPPVAFWAFDRGLRVIRVLYNNIHVRLNSTAVNATRSITTYDKAADLLRVEIIPGSDSLDPRPGQYYFLYQPFRLTGWESHPFTLGSWSYEIEYTKSTPSSPRNIKGNEAVDVSQIPLLSDSSSSSSGSRTPPPTLSETQSRHPKLIFWIRPYDGWTRSLRTQCLKSPDQISNTTILIEGPYGHEFPLWRYDSVLLIAGGTGIASAVPYINDHISRSSVVEEKRMTRVQDMHLVWVTRQSAFIERLVSKELSPALARDDFHASFYATSRREQGLLDAGSSSTDLPTFPARDRDRELEILQGRPNLGKIIATFAEEAHTSDSSAAVLVCGPPRMADEARAAVYAAMQSGYEVRYVEESFTW